MAQSKLSIHINDLRRWEELMYFLLTARPALVKTMNHDPAFWRPVKAEHPTMKEIHRVYWRDAEMIDAIMDSPERAARRFVEDYVLHNIMPIADLVFGVEGVNEMATDDINRWRNMVIFDGFMAEFLMPYGIGYCAGNFGVGHPTRLEYVQIPEIADAWGHPNVVAIDSHCYCAPHMRSEIINKPDEVNEEDGDWYSLRLLKWYPLLDPVAQKPLYIGETGVDGGIHPENPWPGIIGGGWKVNIGNEETYVFGQDDLAWYDAQLQKYPYVIGATVFCNDSDDWESFDVNGSALVKLGQLIQSSATMEEHIGDAMQEWVIPANHEAWFQVYAHVHGLGAARSPEKGYHNELVHGGHPYLAQVFMREDDLTTQHIVYARLDEDARWQDKTHHFDRAN